MTVRVLPIKRLESILEFSYLYDKNKKFSPEKPMGNIGMSTFESVLNASLVGWYQPYLPILERSIEWMRYGISVNEGGAGANQLFRQICLHENLALALWFRDGIDQPELWRQTLKLHEQSLTE